MKLSEIETADLPVREMTITDSQITILYDEVYHIPIQNYIKNIQITITNWWELLVKIFLSPAPYIKPIHRLPKENISRSSIVCNCLLTCLSLSFLRTFPNISRVLTAALWRTSSERSLTSKGYLWIFSLEKSREF